MVIRKVGVHYIHHASVLKYRELVRFSVQGTRIASPLRQNYMEMPTLPRKEFTLLQHSDAQVVVGRKRNYVF